MVYKITYGLHILNLALTYVVVAITQKWKEFDMSFLIIFIYIHLYSPFLVDN